MGAGSSIEVPGGGTEGYHVLRVRKKFNKKNAKFPELETKKIVLDSARSCVCVCTSVWVFDKWYVFPFVPI